MRCVGTLGTATSTTLLKIEGERNPLVIYWNTFSRPNGTLTFSSPEPLSWLCRYIGHGHTQGTLVESIRRKPHSLVLFEGVDKAHPEVQVRAHEIINNLLSLEGGITGISLTLGLNQ